MRPYKKDNSSEPIQLQKHQPERRRAVGTYVFCCGGCCCCCCCLHSLGGLIGAAVASAKKNPSTGRSIAGFYWGSFAVLALGSPACIGPFLGNQSGPLEFDLLVASIFLPVLQLLASVLTLLWIQIRPFGFPDKNASRQALGRITFWSFAGAVAGVIVMIFAVQALQK